MPIGVENEEGQEVGPQLWGAALDGDAAKVRTLLSTQGAQSFINYQEEHGCTPLHIAAIKGHEAVMEKLLAVRCNVNLQDQNGCTPLHSPVHERHETVTKNLLTCIS